MSQVKTRIRGQTDVHLDEQLIATVVNLQRTDVLDFLKLQKVPRYDRQSR